MHPILIVTIKNGNMHLLLNLKYLLNITITLTMNNTQQSQLVVVVVAVKGIICSTPYTKT
jgi:hypothetical protein